MTTCPTCGRQIGEDFAFCPYCATPVAPPRAAREKRKRVTILFCDITGSTALGESTDPEALRALLVRYFERMKRIIESHGGTVEKFIGDAVMAVFGVPVLHEDDALRAVRAASEMQAALPGIGVRCRIGVNSGEVVTGTQERLATGDAVNVAARLEQAARSGEVLIGEETYRLVRDAVVIEAIDPLELKGKSERVPAYRLIDVKQGTERRQLMTPMIGRVRELHRLHDAFAQAVDDRSCQLFTVLGTAGVGKSRLSLEFLQRLDGAKVARGRCLSYGEGITYWPAIEVVRQLDPLPADEYAASVLRSLLGASQAATTAEEIAWAFRKLLEEQAQEQPLVVVFDDIHWGEATFLDLVEHVADLSRDAPMLLLCMARSELLVTRPGWGGGKWNATTVLLEPLAARETDELLDALGAVSDSMRERIRQAAEGNPLFVEEMVALLHASGEAEVMAPPTIQALLAARLDQLDPAERGILECGAVEGRVFHRSAIQALTQEDGNLQEKLLGLVRKELVRPARAELAGDEAYRFRHLLLRDAAYDALPKATRADLHERFAAWLEERGGALVELDEIVGYHLGQAATYKQELGQQNAELAERAGERLARSGRQALWRGDSRAAEGLLKRALILLRPIRLDVYLEMDLLESRALHADARAARLDALADEARDTNDRCGEAVARVVAAWTRELAGISGSIDESEAMARTGIPLLDTAGDHEGLVRMWAVLSDVAHRRCLYGEAARLAEQAILYARHVGRPAPSELRLLARALGRGPRPADQALQTLDRLLTEHPQLGLRPWRAYLLAMVGRLDEAWTEGRAASEQLRELGDAGAMGATVLYEIATLAGEHEAAARYMRLCCDVMEEQGYRAQLSTAAPKLGRSLCALGRFDEAERLAQQGRELGAEDDVITQALWRQVQARVLAHRGEHEEAEQLAREAVMTLEQTDALNWQGDALCDLAEVLERAGRAAQAKVALGQALERYDRKRNLPMVARIRKRIAAEGHSVPLA